MEHCFNIKKCTLFYFFLLSISVYSTDILHLSFHQGCLKNFQQIADELHLKVTSSFIHKDPRFSCGKFDTVTRNFDIYNMTYQRADRIWQRHKDYFNQFDVIVISDTSPLCRIFLQNNWEKPLIIWICNRFDYSHEESAQKDGFPDEEYYQLIRDALNKPHVKFLAYTPYEIVHAQSKGIGLNCPVVRPLGPQIKTLKDKEIPDTVDKQNTLFLYPRIYKQNMNTVFTGLKGLDIPYYYGTYVSPDELTDFKGVIYFPYQYSNLALFENIQRGIVHFVPTKKFLEEHNIYTMHLYLDKIEYCEWYHEDFRDLFVYFDSWEDLEHKVETTNYSSLRKHIIKRSQAHYTYTLNQWRQVFEEVTLLNA